MPGFVKGSGKILFCCLFILNRMRYDKMLFFSTGRLPAAATERPGLFSWPSLQSEYL